MFTIYNIENKQTVIIHSNNIPNKDDLVFVNFSDQEGFNTQVVGVQRNYNLSGAESSFSLQEYIVVYVKPYGEPQQGE